MPAPAALLDLVAHFREQLPDYKRGQYNETQLRRDFLDPLFRLLGWDADNSVMFIWAPPSIGRGIGYGNP